MFTFAQSWPWTYKVLLAVMIGAPMSTLVVLFHKRYGLSAEAFYFAWAIGVIIAFLSFVGLSSTTSLREFVQPAVPFMVVVGLGIFIGGVCNVLMAQAVKAAPNPSLPSAIHSINVPLAYLIAYSLSRLSPNNFPLIKFNWINFGGIFVLIIGLVMVVHKSK